MNFKLAIFFSLVILLQACSSSSGDTDNGDKQALVSVNGKTLTKEELDNSVPKGLNPTDSTLAAEAFIKMWVKNELMYEKAQENLSDRASIDELVENYRQTLTIYTYQEQLLKERLYKEISDRSLEEYYDQNREQFELNNNIIKGLFLKVPLTSPQLEELRKWYKGTNEKSIENIEKYSLQNAVIYDYFFDKWVDFEDVMINIPFVVTDSRQFLRNNKNFEIQDSLYAYLLNIKEYSLIGDEAPFDYIKGHIHEILVNQRRESFIHKFEEDLYNTATKNNQIKIYNK